jgi:hypothetical protein
VDVAGGSDDVTEAQQQANDRLIEGRDIAGQLADELERAARASGGINFGNGGGGDSVSAATGMFQKLDKDTLIFAHAGELAAVIPKNMVGSGGAAFVTAQGGLGRRDRERDPRTPRAPVPGSPAPGGGGDTGGAQSGGDGGGESSESSAQIVRSVERLTKTVEEVLQRETVVAQVNLTVPVELPQFSERGFETVMQERIVPDFLRRIRDNAGSAADELAESLRDRLQS